MEEVEILHFGVDTQCYDDISTKDTTLMYKTQRKAGHTVYALLR